MTSLRLISAAIAAVAANTACGQATGAAIRVEEVLRELDALYVRGDAAGYVARFLPGHGEAMAQRERQLAQAFAASRSRQRTSTVLGQPRQLGGHTIVRARYAIALQCADGAAVPGVAFEEECLLALRADGRGRLQPAFEVETTPAPGCVQEDRFRCEACNYEVGGVDGWLCVPLRADRANALEAVIFLRLGSDLVCDVAVQVDPDASPPETVALDLASVLQPRASATTRQPQAWLPPAHAEMPPAGLRGARLELATGDGARVAIHVVAFGGLQHLLLLRGREASFAREAAAVAALLGSYRLLERDRDLALAAAEPLRHHAGGTLHGNAYENHRFGVTCDGEPGWTAAQRTGGAAFRVVWTSPAGSRFWLTGHAVPPGMARWCRATADRWLARLCEQVAVELRADDPGCSDWHEEACGALTRVLHGAPRAGAAAPARWLRLLLYDDLLLIADGAAAVADDEPAVRRLLAAVRRRH
jgi:hypothetical protein